MVEIFEEWKTKGRGPGVRCFNFKKLSRYGLCRTASQIYTWGFCSRSCSVNTKFGLGKSITRGEFGLEMADFKYYDDPGYLYNKLTLPGVWGDDDNGKKKRFQICLVIWKVLQF